MIYHPPRWSSPWYVPCSPSICLYEGRDFTCIGRYSQTSYLLQQILDKHAAATYTETHIDWAICLNDPCKVSIYQRCHESHFGNEKINGRDRRFGHCRVNPHMFFLTTALLTCLVAIHFRVLVHTTYVVLTNRTLGLWRSGLKVSLSQLRIN